MVWRQIIVRRRRSVGEIIDIEDTRGGGSGGGGGGMRLVEGQGGGDGRLDETGRTVMSGGDNADHGHARSPSEGAGHCSPT